MSSGNRPLSTPGSSLIVGSFTVDELRAMTDAERDALRICRRCWEPYEKCHCGEKKIRAEADRG